jgi:hypothetical protein
MDSKDIQKISFPNFKKGDTFAQDNENKQLL